MSGKAARKVRESVKAGEHRWARARPRGRPARASRTSASISADSERRAVAHHLLVTRSIDAARPRRARRAAGSGSRPRRGPGGTRQSTRSSARAGSTLIFSEALDLRRRERDRHHRLDERAPGGGRPSRCARSRPRGSSDSSPRAGEQRTRRGRSCRSSERRRGEPGDHGSELEQGVVAQAAAARRGRRRRRSQAEAERALLGAAHAVETALAEREVLARRPR